MFKKIFKWIPQNILFVLTLFLLVFIPLYPKLPLIDIKNTWVYVRVEDFLVLATLAVFAVLFIKRKVTLKTPLTVPILLFWIIGAIATIHGIIIIFPTTANIFPNVAFLEYLRHIEYISVFFVAFASIRNKKYLVPVLWAIVITFLGVVMYGFGQKYFSFPAYLTMNEEFAKGIPLHLSDLSRLPSTFAGHYDLAAYLVIIIPILASLVFGIKNILAKISLVVLILLGFIIMFMTVSRVSFFALLIGLFIVLLFQKRKIVLVSIPFIVIIVLLGAVIALKSTLVQRFGNTFKSVDVMVNAKTGEAVGNVSYVPVSYLKDKVVKLQRIENSDQLGNAIGGNLIEDTTATKSAILSYMLMSPNALIPFVKASNISTGENLPQGTGYTNLSLSPVKKRVADFYYELSPNVASTSSAQIVDFYGDFIIKKATAYDLSFTTRFQGEWPNTFLAFERNIFIGSGYGSVSLSVDNNFLRMLGEIGLFGLFSFIGIFLVIGIYIKKMWSSLDSKLAKSFVVGYIAGVVGLAINATLIDVYEASKIAFVLWLLTGVALGVIHEYSNKHIDILNEVRKAVTSSFAVVVYILVISITSYARIFSNLFVSSDYTWLRIGSTAGLHSIGSFFSSITDSLYDPLTKLYFFFMFSAFWLNQDIYHLMSIVLHAAASILFFFIAKNILKNKLVATISVALFLVLSGYSEAVYWISSTGYLFSAVFSLLSLFLFIKWQEKQTKLLYAGIFVSTIIAVLFNGLGIIIPFVLLVYGKVYGKKKTPILLFIPSILYLLLRFQTIFQFLKTANILLPVELLNNLYTYMFISVLGGISSPVFHLFETKIIVSLVFLVIFALMAVMFVKKIFVNFSQDEKRLLVFSSLFFIITLSPFLFLPASSTFVYLPSTAVIIVISYEAKKLYNNLLLQGKEIALGVVTVLLLVYSLLHIIQVQESQLDWRTAGETMHNFFISVDDLYSNRWSQPNMRLNFVDVPHNTGSGLILSQGLPDALWFAFQNDGLIVATYPTVEDALIHQNLSLGNRILDFQNDGSLNEITRQNPK